ncbi:MAG TPA: hypothetical protein VGA99_11810 [bacterium]
MAKFLSALVCIFFVFGFQTTAAQQSTEQDTLRELMRRIDILTEEIEKSKLGEVAETKYESRFGMGPAASRVYQLTKTGVSLAGYGEIVYSNFASELDNGIATSQKDQIDYLRHITYFGFRFNDWLLFNSEIEYEHAKTDPSSPGAVSVEFGYVEAMLNPVINIRAGMVLVPVGIINEFHEPPTYHGSLRPETEQQIIPTTWRTNGFGLVGATQRGFGYRLYVVESLNAANFSSSGIRSGRQNGAQALAENLAISGRLDYTGVSGLDVGGSFFVGNTGQSLSDTSGNELDARLSLFSVHFMFARKGMELRGLFVQSTISDVAELNAVRAFSGANSIGEKQQGYYFTLAYDVLPHLMTGTTHYLAPFVQYEKLNTQTEVPAGFAKNLTRERSNLSFGLTYKPHPNVAFKVDYINRDNEANSALDQFNVAVNYLF